MDAKARADCIKEIDLLKVNNRWTIDCLEQLNMLIEVIH